MAKNKAKVPVRALRTQSKTGGAKQINSVQTVRVVDRRYKIMELRRHGWSIPQIAETLKIGQQTIAEDLKAVLAMTIKELGETTEEQRQIEIERYDALLRFYQPLAEAGNLAAAGLVLSISASRRKLCALDKPEEKHAEETAVRIYVGVDIDMV